METDTLSRGEKRFYSRSLSRDIVIEKIDTKGRTSAFFSRTYGKPTSAVHDAEINGPTVIRYMPPPTSNELVVGIEGLDEVNQYNLRVSSVPRTSNEQTPTSPTTVVEETFCDNLKYCPDINLIVVGLIVGFLLYRLVSK
ncbi:hypothetical protein HDE_00452 [Halotydeus destructor]|nr:hypothetical protein HDE_00452 [Halotydeus destructor]